jgi:hypothetical protein
MLPPSSASKNKPNKNLLHAGFFIGLLFDPEAEGKVFLQIIS